MSKRLFLVLAVAVVGLAVGGAVGRKIEYRHPTFTAVRVENHYDITGKPRQVFYDTYSVWPDGSTEEVRQAVDGRPTGIRIMEDVERGVRAVLDTGTSSKTSYALSTSEFEQAKAKLDCSSDPPAGTILGYPVVTESKTTERGPNRTVAQRKLAPSLNCFPLYDSTVLEDSSGRRLASASKTVTYVMRSEPDRSELAIPPDFIERKPSEAMALHRQLRKQQCPDCEIRTGAILDEAYDSRRVEPGTAPK